MPRPATASPAPPEGHVLKTLGHLVQKSEGGKPVFRMSTAVLDRHKDRVFPDKVKTENFEKNPVLLWNHDDCLPAIGTCRVFQEGEEWFMEPTFDELDELSKTVSAKVKAGTLRTCSIRFRFFDDFDFNAEGGLDYGEVELLEVSVVNIPANPEAVRVKTLQTTKPKSSTPPTEETPAKALEQGDLDAIQASVAAAMAPLMEKIDALAAQLAEGSAAKSDEPEETPEEEKDEDAEPEPEEEKDKGAEAAAEGEGEADEDDSVEMSAEEAEEMKAFISPLSPAPKKPKK